MYLKSGAATKEATFHDDAVVLEDACAAKLGPKVERWCRCPGFTHPIKMAPKMKDGKEVTVTTTVVTPAPDCRTSEKTTTTTTTVMEQVEEKDEEGAVVKNKNGEVVYVLDYDEDKI